MIDTHEAAGDFKEPSAYTYDFNHLTIVGGGLPLTVTHGASRLQVAGIVGPYVLAIRTKLSK